MSTTTTIPTHYIIHHIDEPITIDGKVLKIGFYRIVYDLSGMDYPHDAQYSEDRCEWVDCPDLFNNLQEFNELFGKIKQKSDKLMKMERMDYVETIFYRDQYVPVFMDDCGQSFYCIFNNKEISFGSFQSEYEDDVRHLIDCELSRKW